MAARRAPPPRLAPAVTHVGGVELAPLVASFWEALLKHPRAKPLRKSVPKVVFKETATGYHGVAYEDKHLVNCFFGEGCDKAQAMELILHELAHLVTPTDDHFLREQIRLTWSSTAYDPTTKHQRLKRLKSELTALRRREFHGEWFKTILRDTAVALWGEEVRVSIYFEGRCYILDDLIIKALRVKLGLPWRKGSWLKDFEPPAPKKLDPTWTEPKLMRSSELHVLPVGTKVRGHFSSMAWVYIRVQGGFVPESTPGVTPYDCITFSNLPDKFSLCAMT